MGGRLKKKTNKWWEFSSTTVLQILWNGHGWAVEQLVALFPLLDVFRQLQRNRTQYKNNQSNLTQTTQFSILSHLILRQHDCLCVPDVFQLCFVVGKCLMTLFVFHLDSIHAVFNLTFMQKNLWTVSHGRFHWFCVRCSRRTSASSHLQTKKWFSEGNWIQSIGWISTNCCNITYSWTEWRVTQSGQWMTFCQGVFHAILSLFCRQACTDYPHDFIPTSLPGSFWNQ